MSAVISAVKWAIANYDMFLTAVAVLIGATFAFVNGMLAVAAAIPGEQPDKLLQALADHIQGVADFWARVSRKPKVKFVQQDAAAEAPAAPGSDSGKQ